MRMFCAVLLLLLLMMTACCYGAIDTADIVGESKANLIDDPIKGLLVHAFQLVCLFDHCML